MDVTIVNAEQFGRRQQLAARGDRAAYRRYCRAVTVTFLLRNRSCLRQYDIYVAWDDTLGFNGYTKVGSTTNVNGDQVHPARSGRRAEL